MADMETTAEIKPSEFEHLRDVGGWSVARRGGAATGFEWRVLDCPKGPFRLPAEKIGYSGRKPEGLTLARIVAEGVAARDPKAAPVCIGVEVAAPARGGRRRDRQLRPLDGCPPEPRPGRAVPRYDFLREAAIGKFRRNAFPNILMSFEPKGD